MTSKSSKKRPTTSPSRRLRNWLLTRFRPTPTTDTLPDHLAVGIWGESVAESYLKKKGYRRIGRRVRIGPRDEIDLIMQAGRVLVFVEVRTRSSEAFGRPLTSLKHRKRRALARAARRYLSTLRLKPDYYRFDMVEVIGSPHDDDAPLVRQVKAAVTISTAPVSLGNLD